MTDTPEQRVEEAARAIKLKLHPMGCLATPEECHTIATAALASSERTIAERDARIVELESKVEELWYEMKEGRS